MVIDAVERDLAKMGDLKDSALAAAAKVLAGRMDDPSNSATSVSMCSRALVEIMDKLRDLAPPVREASPLDEIRARRDAKVARKSGA